METKQYFRNSPKITLKRDHKITFKDSVSYHFVSRKVVLQTGQSLRDNVESYYG